jgi:hypothetical protein
MRSWDRRAYIVMLIYRESLQHPRYSVTVDGTAHVSSCSTSLPFSLFCPWLGPYPYLHRAPSIRLLHLTDFDSLCPALAHDRNVSRPFRS